MTDVGLRHRTEGTKGELPANRVHWYFCLVDSEVVASCSLVDSCPLREFRT